jgi:hypothetical protein
MMQYLFLGLDFNAKLDILQLRILAHLLYLIANAGETKTDNLKELNSFVRRIEFTKRYTMPNIL